MIYTRFGTEFKVKGMLELVHVPGFENGLTLVSDGEQYQFAEFLKADGGWQEINEAIHSSPALHLTDDEFKAALLQAS